MAEPQANDPASGPGSDADPGADDLAERIGEDLAALTELTATGIEIDGEVQVTESTWVVYGHSGYDGEVIVGEYHDASEAAAVLRAGPRPATDDERPIP